MRRRDFGLHREVRSECSQQGIRYEYEANFLWMPSARLPRRFGRGTPITCPQPFPRVGDTWRMARAFARPAGRIVGGAT